jgi:hypothetical protein
MSINPVEFCNEWTVREFYHLSRYLAWESKAHHDYHEIMAAKYKAK